LNKVDNQIKKYKDTVVMAKGSNCIRLNQILLLGCLFLISACTVVPVKDRKDISAKLPAQFSASDISESEISLTWEQSFPSASLKSDVRALLEANFELEAARARVEQAAAAYGISKSALMPSVDANAGFERSREEADDDPDSTETDSTISFGAALYWEPDIWGRLRSRKEAASLMLEEKQVLADQVALKMQFLLVETWITWHASHRLEDVLTAQQTTNMQILELNELRLAQGDGNSLDVLQQKGRMASVDREMPGVVSEKQSAANAYAVLMGRFPGDGVRPADDWPVLKPLTTVSSPRQLMAERPDLRAAFLALQAADHELAAAIAARLPRISIGLAYTESGSRASEIGGQTALRFASGLLAPVFDAGRLKAKADQRKAETRESLAILEQAMLTAVREVEDALIREKALFDERMRLKKEIEIAEQTVGKARLRYVNGQETFLPVLAALAKLQTLQRDEITLKQDILTNRCRLLKAVGAEWSRDGETF